MPRLKKLRSAYKGVGSRYCDVVLPLCSLLLMTIQRLPAYPKFRRYLPVR